MNDPHTSRLDQLHFLRRVQEADLHRTRRWIEVEERRQTERERGEQRRPPEPDWLIEHGIGDGPAVYVHAGGCHMAGKRSRGVGRDQALRALTGGVDACPQCRPDTALGYLEG